MSTLANQRSHLKSCLGLEKLDEAKKVVAAKKRAINAVKPATKNTLKKMDELGVIQRGS